MEKKDFGGEESTLVSLLEKKKLVCEFCKVADGYNNGKGERDNTARARFKEKDLLKILEEMAECCA